MDPDPSTRPSFSRVQKWRIALNVLATSIAVLAVMVAVNYIGNRILFKRFYLSSKTRIELSPRTHNLLNSITNRVKVTLYYDKEDSLYDDITAVLSEFHLANPRITIQTVDYHRDVSTAQEIKSQYHLFGSSDKNLVIFDCAGHSKIVPGDALAQYTVEQVPSEDAQKLEFRKKPVAFYGEIRFSSAVLEVTSPKPLKAYFAQGHGEPTFDEAGPYGLGKFSDILTNNNIQVESLSIGTNAIPSDCNLLIIAGPVTPMLQSELDQIEKYLEQGGRLFVAFNAASIGRYTGLEKILGKWGVNVSQSIVQDAVTVQGNDVMAQTFANSHPITQSMVGSELYLIQPRMIGKSPLPDTADAPKVDEIVFSSTNSTLIGYQGLPPRPYPLAVAVDKGSVKGVASERGTTRILAMGDSVFLGNIGITSLGNSDFTYFAVNWLADRTTLLQGVGSKSVTDFRVVMTRQQMQTTKWLLLGALPGGILMLGGVVWLGRRR